MKEGLSQKSDRGLFSIWRKKSSELPSNAGLKVTFTELQKRSAHSNSDGDDLEKTKPARDQTSIWWFRINPSESTTTKQFDVAGEKLSPFCILLVSCKHQTSMLLAELWSAPKYYQLAAMIVLGPWNPSVGRHLDFVCSCWSRRWGWAG